MGKSLSGYYGARILGRTKKPAIDVLKIASKRALPNAAETTGEQLERTLQAKLQKLLQRKIKRPKQRHD